MSMPAALRQERRAMNWRAVLWCLLAAAAVAACLVQIARAGRLPLQTDLLALLPATEQNPVAEAAVTRLASATGNRAVFLVGGDTAASAAEAARRFAAVLRESRAFGPVIADVPPMDTGQWARFYLEHRFTLLAPGDRAALGRGETDLDARLKRKLYAPFRIGLTAPLADDPFGFTDAWLASLPLNRMKLEPQNGMLMTHDARQSWALVSAELAGSAYDGDVQRGVATAVEDAEAILRQASSQSAVLRAGTIFYAGAARQSAEREVDLIGAGSMAGMLALLYLVFRSLRPLALGLLSVGFGICTAVAVTIAVYGEMHLITLVFGASLIGEAIDYAVQYFAANLGAGDAWEPMTGLRTIAPGITVALATSLLGYGVLLLAPFPALAQIALFAIAGLSAAWLSVFLLLPALLPNPSRRDPEAAVALPQRFLGCWQARMTRRACLILAGCLLVAAIPGWQRLSGNDDVRQLVSRPAALVSQEERIRELTGFAVGSQFFLVEGDTPEAVLQREEKLAARLDGLAADGAIGGYQALSAFVPSLQRQAENRHLWAERVFGDRQALRNILARNGLRDDVGERQIADFTAGRGQPLRLEEWLQTDMAKPFAHLWMGATTAGYASIVV
ncbi:MAG: MMPL family transporter, partial [Ignavibacteria bacterium]